jgi:hypothetical protein
MLQQRHYRLIRIFTLTMFSAILLSANPSVTLDYVLRNPQHRWCYCALTHNPNITLRDILARPDINWCYESMAAKASITVNDIIANPTIPWRIGFVALNPNLTFTYAIILLNCNGKSLDCHLLCLNKNFTMDDVKDYKEAYLRSSINWWQCHVKDGWDKSKNRNTRIEDIKGSRKWNMVDVSRYANITWQDVIDNPKIPWSRKYLNANENITMDDITSARKHKRALKGVGMNPNITPDFIAIHRNKIHRCDLLGNHFIWHSDQVYQGIVQQIKEKRNKTAQMLAPILCRDLAWVVARYTEML